MSERPNSHRRPEIPALTGIRLIAAISILCNHLLLHIFPADTFPQLAPALRGSGILGMNLFFILSGFIIHYNYSYSFKAPSFFGFYRFFAARFSRLYPLFFAFVAFELCTENYVLLADGLERNIIFRALPYFFTLSQTWHYELLAPSTSLAYSLSNSSITWSISTEFLMYAMYPFIVLGCLFDADILRTRILKALLGAITLSWCMRWVINHQSIVDSYGIHHFGASAGFDLNPSHSFAFWFLFLSPYFRIFEFIIGALISHLVIGLMKHPVSGWGKVALTLGCLAAICEIVGTYLPFQYHCTAIDRFFQQFGYYPEIAVLIFACAYWEKCLITRFLALRPLVWFGEASYSIYLLHIVFYNRFSFHSDTGGQAALRAIATILVILITARGIYELYEMPMRKLMNHMLMHLIATTTAVA